MGGDGGFNEWKVKGDPCDPVDGFAAEEEVNHVAERDVVVGELAVDTTESENQLAEPVNGELIGKSGRRRRQSPNTRSAQCRTNRRECRRRCICESRSCHNS